MSNLKIQNVFKCVITLILFFTYTFIFNALFTIFSIENKSLTLFISDIAFLIFIICFYRQDLKADLKKFKFKVSMIIGGFLLIFLLTLIINGLISSLVKVPVVNQDYQTLTNLNTIYVIFKVLIFGVLAEELVFRKALGKAIANPIIFVLISALLYSIANVLYWDLSLISSWINAISYFIIYLILSIIYVKSKNNLIPVIIIKFLYSLIFLSIILIS